MHILPLQSILILWLALNSWITQSNDTFCNKIIRITKKKTKDIVCTLALVHEAIANLTPT